MNIKVNRKLIELDIELHLDLNELSEMYRAFEQLNMLHRGLPSPSHEMRDKLAAILKENDPNF